MYYQYNDYIISEQGNLMIYDRASAGKIVDRIKYAVNRDKFELLRGETRQKNDDFITLYNLPSNKIKSILIGLEVDDYSETSPSTKEGYENELLHIFGPTSLMQAVGEDVEKDVIMYVKISIIERRVDDFVVVVSFHEAEKEIKYAFK